MSIAEPLAGAGSESELRGRVRAIVIELAPNRDESLPDSATLVEDFGYHSLALLELAFAIEDEFDLMSIDEETARGIRTLKDVQDHVVNELDGQADPVA